MIYLIAAAVLAFLFISYVCLVATDWDWGALGMFWGALTMIVLIAWLFAKGMTEVSGQ